MDYGPVLSGVYDLIKGKPVDDALPLWSKFISQRGENYVFLLSDPGNEDLCEEEEEIIQQVYQAFGHLDPFHVAEWTHDLPEWRDPNGSALPITVEDILKNVGKSDKEISEISERSHSGSVFRWSFECLASPLSSSSSWIFLISKLSCTSPKREKARPQSFSHDVERSYALLTRHF